MKLIVNSEHQKNSVPKVVFSVVRDDIYNMRLRHPTNELTKMMMSDVIVQYDFFLRKFSITKDRHNLGEHWFAKRFFDGMQLTDDFHIAKDAELMWFTLQYENVDIDRVVDFPGTILD